MDGAEAGNAAARGWGRDMSINTTFVHNTLSGRSLRSYDAPFNGIAANTFDRGADGRIPRLVEVYMGWTTINTNLVSTNLEVGLRSVDNTTGYVRITGNAAATELYTPNVLRASSAAFAFTAPGEQRSYLMHYRVANSAALGGQADVYIGANDGTTPDLTFAGDTQLGGAYVDGVRIDQGPGRAWCIDDIVVWAPAIEVSGLSASPAVGETITGGTSGATANVSWVDAVAGVVFIYDWNGTDFIDGETIAFGGGATATLVAPDATTYLNGLAPFSTFEVMQNLYIVARPPSTNVAQGFAPSTGASNVALIDDIPVDDTDYVQSTSGASVTDTYGGFAALTASDEPLAVSRYTWATGAGAYNRMVQVLTGSAGAQSVTEDLPAMGWVETYYPTQADGSAWTRADIPGLQTSITAEP